MDPQTLPAREQELYEKIREQYKVAFEPLNMGEVRLNLLTITDLEPLLDGKDPLKNPSDFPFWVKLWEAAIVLAQFLAGQNHGRGLTPLDSAARPSGRNYDMSSPHLTRARELQVESA